jgi:hypothetical protein
MGEPVKLLTNANPCRDGRKSRLEGVSGAIGVDSMVGGV